MLFNEVKFLEDYKVFKKNDIVLFKDNLTIISGDNGSGKSTLIGCIRNMFNVDRSYSYNIDNNNKIILDNEIDYNKKKVFFLDTCKDADVIWAGFKSEHKTIEDDILSIKNFKKSSGEASGYQIINFLNNAHEADLVLIDEPERGLSIKNQYLLANFITRYHKNNPNTQIIITTHSEIMLNLKDKIWSTTHKNEMKTDEYISWLHS